MVDTTSQSFNVIPAATVVIFRKGAAGGYPELLMLQRSKEMRFAGGAAVFPGGRVDPEDRALAASLSLDADLDEVAARVAAVRETLEESGLAIALRQPVSAVEAADARSALLEEGALLPVLERFGWELSLDCLVPFTRWCPIWEGAFDTRFYLTDIGTGAVDIAVDATENSHLFWDSAASALARADVGEIDLIFPTRRNLERLAQFASFSEARIDAEAYHPVRTISPRHEERDGERWLVIPDNLGYPVTEERVVTVRRG